MTQNFHTPLLSGEAANAAKINAPLGELDTALTTLDARVDATEHSMTALLNLIAYPTANTYYVDSVRGNDSNSGANGAAPLQTIGALAGRITAGSVIYLARNSHWREQLTIAADNVSVLAYGAGARPLLDCSDVIAAGAWSKTGGQTYVYQASVSPALAAQDTWVRCWENGNRLVRATSVANCDATAGSYFPSADTGSVPITIYIHAADGSNPASNGMQYEYNARGAGIYSFGYSGLSLMGLHTRRNLWEMGSLMLGDGNTLADCLAEDGSKHNLYYGEGSTLTDVICRDAYYTGPCTYFIGYKAEPTGRDLTHVRCRAENTTGVIDANATGFYFHSSGEAHQFGRVTFTDCEVEGLNVGLDTALYFNSCEIDGLTCTNCNYAVAAWKSLTISGLTHTCPNGKRCISLYTDNVAPTPAITLNLSDSTLTMATGGTPTGGLIWSSWPGMTVNLSNVHFIGQENEICVVLTGTTGVVTAVACDFEGVFAAYKVDDGTITSDYNRFRDWIVVYHDGSTYNGVVAWQATGQDAHSTTS